MIKGFLLFATIAGALAVVAGALLAHGLKPVMPAPAQDIYETAVRYQFYHVFALLFTGLMGIHLPGAGIRRAGYCFMAGILLFSGSLYLISYLVTIGHDVPVIIGILTPIGGLGFILGWFFLARSLLK